MKKNKNTIRRASLLKRRTQSEIRLSEALLITSEFDFSEQHHFKTFQRDYFADFYFPASKVIVELDGGVHSRQIEYDQQRDRELRMANISPKRWLRNEIVRFENEYVDTEIWAVLQTIKNAINRQFFKIYQFGTNEDKERLRQAMIDKTVIKHIRQHKHEVLEDWHCNACEKSPNYSSLLCKFDRPSS